MDTLDNVKHIRYVITPNSTYIIDTIMLKLKIMK